MKRTKTLFSKLSDELKSEVKKINKHLTYVHQDNNHHPSGVSAFNKEVDHGYENPSLIKKSKSKSQLRISRQRTNKKKNDLFEFRKLILVTDLMLSRGFIQQGKELLAQLLKESYERELIEEQSQLIALIDLYNIKLRMNNTDIKYHRELIDVIRKFHESLNHYNSYMRKNEKGYEKTFRQREETLAILKKNYETTNLARIGYFYYFSSLRFHQEAENYPVANFYGEHLLHLIEKHPKIFSENVKAKSTVEYLKTLINLNDSKKALEICYNLMQICVPHSKEEAKCLEFFFILHFQRQEYRILPEIINKAKRNRYIRENRFYFGKWTMFGAAVFFMEKNYEEALKQLKDCCKLPREKTEWVLHAQLLQIMCRIELGQCEWFYYRCEALRKSISRYESKNQFKLNGRISVIYRLLKGLNKNGYDFNLLIEDENDLFDLLHCSEGNFYWNPLGPELLRFEEWIQIKARTQQRKRGRNLVA